MRILLTNDDGITAPGILALREALATVGEVVLVAPNRQRSAAGHSITLHKPLRIDTVTVAPGVVGHAVSGTPTDCVTMGYFIVMEERCDLVVSGINPGANLGWDVTYSGTVAAAMEGAVLGIPSMAVSLVLDERGGDAPLDFGHAARFAARLAMQLHTNGMPEYTLLNVNIPATVDANTGPAEITHQGRREYIDRIVSRVDPGGRPYYWQTGSIREVTPDPGSDVHAVLAGRISITPLHLDLTARSAQAQLRSWALN